MTLCCGNQVPEPAAGEQCDDGNQVETDGCSADCLFGCGDANQTGALTSDDALRILAVVVGALDVSSCPFALCDVDLDGAITVADALLVLRAAVDLPAELCDVSTVRFSDTTTSTTVSSTTTSTSLPALP